MPYVYSNKRSLINKRKLLRKNPTSAEQILWRELYGGKIGIRFRRQYSIGSYIADFYCHEFRLIIELDGPIHNEQKEYDRRRENFLKNKGFKIIRFKNDKVLFEREKVIEKIKNACNISSQ
ncbi:MAG: endonuclease domain-containing protein [Candidatus Magasanikbacteria bacterium]|nr:endonuclease domain-containing protein [Candidatus Magasanikbacteria bacterium]